MEIANVHSEEGKRMSPRRRSSTPRENEKADNKKKDSRGRILDDRDRVGRYEKYTPLNASRSQIWREVVMMEMKKVDRPRPIFDRGGLDKFKYCTFHDGPRHNIDQCWDLRDDVEKLVREGKLYQYVIKCQGSRNNKRKSGNRKRSKSLVTEKKRKEDRNQKDDSNNDEFPEAEFDCNVISGALGGGGDTVKKIFVDAGSSADIILWDTFKKMNLDEEDLKPCKTTLIAFNGKNTPPKGYIDLRLTLGTKEAFKSERVRFIVADFPSEYNVILGRPTLHKWDMLVSTKHQKIKMVCSKNEIITIHGDQKESRECYFETVKGKEGGHLSPSRIR
ncbi:uncharacterized protein LOC133304889 [Gastrolobium bilobum]|uniref:uncharacterized protein LOC133304889 n=1 Tax=Gastrolobium bilobum TaxID=150636 RepID=UPI002AB1D991|nr:uncharacterized protein LOC133304889 [Gastrolobium bilobum]